MAKKKAEVTENVETTDEKAVKVVTLVAVKNFNDRYTKTLYAEGTEFIVDDTVTEITKITDKKYKITTKRAEDFKAKKFVK